MCRDPREQEQPRLPRRAPVLPLPLLAARIRRDPPEVHHHAEQDQVAESHITYYSQTFHIILFRRRTFIGMHWNILYGTNVNK